MFSKDNGGVRFSMKWFKNWVSSWLKFECQICGKKEIYKNQAEIFLKPVSDDDSVILYICKDCADDLDNIRSLKKKYESNYEENSEN